MNVIIFYEHISREGEEIKLIAEFLRKNKVEVKIYSITFQYANALYEIKKHKYDAIVVPWLHHDKDYELMTPFIKCNPNVVIINLSHEEIGSQYSIPLIVPVGENAKNSVFHFVWGKYFEEFLIGYGVKKDKIVITGNGRTDFIYKNGYSKKELAAQYKLSSEKKWILFAEDRGWALNWSEKKAREMKFYAIPEEDTNEFIEFIKESVSKTEKDFANLNNKFYEKYELIYRPHPGTRPMNNLDERIKVISDYSIYEWLRVVDLNVVWSSTTVFESDAMGVPSIIYNPIEKLEKYKTFGIDNYLCIHSISEINDALISQAKNTQEEHKAYIKYFGIVDGCRCQNIANKIIEVINNKQGYPINCLKMDFKRKLRIVLRGFVAYIFTKFKLVNILKFPKSAYLGYNDIPWLFGKDLK